MNLKKFYKEARLGLQMAFINLGATLLDFCTSLRITPPHQESNPFARHVDGSFWPYHAFINCSVVTVEYAVLSAMFYVAGGPLGWKARRMAAGLPWLYLAVGHIEGAFSNILLQWPHLYVITYNDMLRSMMGQ
jgi:hypothetical protein